METRAERIGAAKTAGIEARLRGHMSAERATALLALVGTDKEYATSNRACGSCSTTLSRT